MDQRGGSGNADPHQCEIKASGAAANRPRTVGPGCESVLAWIEGLSAGGARFGGPHTSQSSSSSSQRGSIRPPYPALPRNSPDIY